MPQHQPRKGRVISAAPSPLRYPIRLKPGGLRIPKGDSKRTKEGDTLDGIAHSLQALVLSFPERFKGQEHQQSEIIDGFFQAAQELNSKASEGNVIIAVTDGVENSDQARCGSGACKLPLPSFALSGASVYLYGVGQGLTAPKAQQLTLAWEGFFKPTGAAVVELHRD